MFESTNEKQRLLPVWGEVRDFDVLYDEFIAEVPENLAVRRRTYKTMLVGWRENFWEKLNILQRQDDEWVLHHKNVVRRLGTKDLEEAKAMVAAMILVEGL